MWAELALNESKQGIIRNRFTFFLLFLFPCNGSIIRRCASGRGGKAPQPRACPSGGGLAVRLAQRRTERCCKAWLEVGAGHTPGLIPAALGLPEEQDTAPLPTASPASGCVPAHPGPRAQSPLTAGSCFCQVEGEGLVSKGSSMCESWKLPFGKCMSFSFNMVPCCILSL